MSTMAVYHLGRVKTVSNSVLERMPLTDDRRKSLTSVKAASLPRMQLYRRLAASTSLPSSVQNSSSAAQISSPSLAARIWSKSSWLDPMTLPPSSTSSTRPRLTPWGTLKLIIWSFHVGGDSGLSSWQAVSRDSSPMVTLTARLLPPSLRLTVAASKRKVREVAGSSSKCALRVTKPNCFCLSAWRMHLNSQVSAFLEIIGLASTAPQATTFSPSKTASSMVLPIDLQKLLIAKLQFQFTR